MLVISLLILLVSNSLTFLKKNINSIFLSRITSISLLYSVILTYNGLYFQSIGKGVGIFNGLFQITISTQIIEMLIFLIGAIILFSWPLLNKGLSSSNNEEIISFADRDDNSDSDSNGRVLYNTSFSSEYSLIALFSILGSSLLICSVDLISMYLCIELQSFALYVLTTLNKESHSSVSAGLKYFLLGGLSSCFILLGAGFIYSYTGLTNFESIYSLINVLSSSEGLENLNIDPLISDISGGFTIGLIITIVGFLFKVSAAPFHNWSPDVYDESPSIITVWLSIMAKLSIFIFLLYFIKGCGLDIDISIINTDYTEYVSGFQSLGIIKNLLLISSLLSLLVGTIVGLSQVKIRRLLAYSSISHVGFLLLALGINSEKSIESFIFYISQYSITSLNIFLILLAYSYFIFTPTPKDQKFSEENKQVRDIAVLSDREAEPFLEKDSERSTRSIAQLINIDINYISQLKGQFIANPILSISLAICLLSMAGIPPLIGFFSKQFVLYSSIQDGYYFLSLICIVVSVISASYYLKIIKVVFFEAYSENAFNNLEGGSVSSETIENMNKNLNKVKSQALSSTIKNKGTEITLAIKRREEGLTNIHSYIIAFLTFIILFFFINPSILLYVSQLISLNFY